MASTSASPNGWWIWGIDAVVVVAFAVIGRDSHGFTSDWGEVLRISMPFLIALAIAAAVLVRVLAPRFKLATPTSLVGGLWMGVATLSVGTILRRVLFGDGTAMVFVVVTTAWIVGLMAGWRLVYTVSRRLMASRT